MKNIDEKSTDIAWLQLRSNPISAFAATF